jgi:cation diffusion facilitator family transporter
MAEDQGKKFMNVPCKLALYSTGVNILVAATKGFFAWLSGSSALLADAIHGFSDTLASLLVLVGIWLAKKKSEEFPWGLYKVENFVALISAGLIFFAGYEIVLSAFTRETAITVAFIFPTVLSLAGLIMAVSFFSWYENKRARVLNSPSLLADASHWYSDIASTAIVLLALVGSWIGYPFIDRLAALVMVVFIAKVGWGILKDSMRTLLDASVAPGTLERIREVILRFEQVKEITSIEARNSGRYIFIRAKLIFGTKKFSQAHQLSEEIERTIQKEIPLVDQITIHYEPLQKNSLIYGVPVGRDQKTISDHLGEAPYFRLFQVSTTGNRVLEEKILPNPYLKEEKGKGIKVSTWLIENQVDAVYTHRSFSGKGPSYVFENSEVRLIVTDAKTIQNLSWFNNSG